MADTEEEEQNYLEIIKSESDRLTRLINDVLDISKMEAGRMPFEFSKVEVNKLINTSIDGLASLANKHNHKIINEMENCSTCVLADSDKIVQVVSNILSNAVKFTPDGGLITISGMRKNNTMQISISDNGIGIKNDDISKVFDKFQQIEDVSHHSEGTGLGMPISKLIIENHNGKIWLESETKIGTTFYFTLPVVEI
jgi:signal transduction histidine kinase